MSVKNKTNKNYKRSQKGRSMVEMLGVLAIIGVLSVGGVYGYGVAMKKHKANELLHQASMIATTVSAQAMTNNGTLPSTITDFGSTNYGSFSKTVTEKGNQFVLTIEGLDGSVCEQLKSGGVVQSVQCVDSATSGKKDAKISYYKNLATNEKDGYAGGAYGPQVDENGCYEVTYQTGACCKYQKTEKICPGETVPNTSCTPPESYMDCLCSEHPGDGDNYDCMGGSWSCVSTCDDGPQKGECIYKCPCDESKKPEGDAVKCGDFSSGNNGGWLCDGIECSAGLDAGKCMHKCRCGEAPGEGYWNCQEDGSWYCPTYSPDGKECMF